MARKSRELFGHTSETELDMPETCDGGRGDSSELRLLDIKTRPCSAPWPASNDPGAELFVDNAQFPGSTAMLLC